MTKNDSTPVVDESLDAKARTYLRLPYFRALMPESDGTWRGQIMEFPGCIATGENQELALKSLEETAYSWLCSAIYHGQYIPEPVDAREYSGRIGLRLQKSLHRKAATLAEIEGVSLNQFISNALAEAVGDRRRSLSVVHPLSISILTNFNQFNNMRLSTGDSGLNATETLWINPPAQQMRSEWPLRNT